MSKNTEYPPAHCWNIVCPHSTKTRDIVIELENYRTELWLKKIGELVKAPYFKNKEVSD